MRLDYFRRESDKKYNGGCTYLSDISVLLLSQIYYSLKSSDRKPGVGFPGAPGGPDPGAGVGPGDFTCQKPGAGGFLL